MLFAAIHIPDYPAVALARTLPDIAAPLVVLDGQPPQEQVISINDAARAIGFRHGMSRVQAESISAARFLSRDAQREETTFARLCDVAGAYSPRLEAIASPRNDYGDISPSALLLLDASGMGTLFGTVQQYATRLHRAMSTARFPTGVAVAPNAEAALMLSRSMPGLVVSNEANVRDRLASLPVTLLPCEARTLATLRNWGIRTLGQLAALPETALISRLGQQGKRLQLLSRGQAERLLVPEAPEFVLLETVQLDTPVELLDSLLFVVSPMLDTLMRRALERAYALRSLQLRLKLEQHEPHTIKIQPAFPTQSRETLLKLLNLELQAKPPQSGIIALTLSAEAAQPPRAQRGLFQSQFPEPDRLDLLLARLRAIAGEGNVGSPQLLNSHREDAFTITRFEAHLTEQGQRINEDKAFGLALRMLRPHPSVRVSCWADRPKLLFWNGVRHSIDSCAGPWHSSGSWWDGQAWDVDLWDVVTIDPIQAMRLQRDCSSNAWSLVGIYD